MRPRKTVEGYQKTTWIVHGPSRTAKWDYAHHVVPPLTSSTAYRLESVERGARGFGEYGSLPSDTQAPIYIYDRLDEPTRQVLEGELAALEGSDACLTFASGMAAVSAALGAVLKNGDEVVAHTLLYGCTHSLFERWYPRLGIRVRRADFTRPREVEAAVNARTRVLYFESPVNPTLDLVDIAAVRRIANKAGRGRPKDRGILVMIDNTFATPFCQRPIERGADLVIHSLTKNISGFGTEVGGAVMCSKELYSDLKFYRKDFGGSLSAKSAWAILVYGLPTLPLRLKRQQYSALRVARFLEKHPAVLEVRYPGLPSFSQRALAEKQMTNFEGEFAPGNMIYFRLRKELADPVAFVDDLAKRAYSVTLAVSLGHVKTLIEMPSAMTHSAYGPQSRVVAPDGIRLSVGLESPLDIIRDLGESLKRVGSSGRNHAPSGRALPRPSPVSPHLPS